VRQSLTYNPETRAGLPSGRYTLTCVAGLDLITNPELFPIVRFVKLHAFYRRDR
jgi:hypothetical protein